MNFEKSYKMDTTIKLISFFFLQIFVHSVISNSSKCVHRLHFYIKYFNELFLKKGVKFWNFYFTIKMEK